MKSRSSHASTPTPASLVQTSPIAGFKFSAIGQNPTLLDRMGDNIHVTLRTPSPERKLSQDRTGSSLSLSRHSLSRSQATGAPPVERDSPINSTLVQHQPNPLGSTPMFSPLSESHDVKFPHSYDQRRTSVISDLQYPNAAPDSWPSFADQPAPMDQGPLPPHQHPIPRNAAAASVPGGGLSNGVADGPAEPLPSTLPHRSRSLASTEPKQLRQPVEDLIKLASVREERMSRQRDIFDLRSGELSTFSSDASRATKAVQDQMGLVKLQAEELHAQAGQMLQEANKTRELADRLIASVETLYVDVPNATKHVDHLVERSEQMSSFMRKTFGWLATLRVREQKEVDAIQVELAEQALAEINRLVRIQEEQRKAEAQEKVAREEEEEEEREAAKKKAEEEEEAARQRSFVAQRAAFMEQKRKASEANAQSIQAKRRERKPVDVSGSGSNAPPTVFPGVASEHTSNAQLSTSFSLPPVVPTPTHTPARGQGQLEVSTPLFQPPPSPNKARAVPASVCFVPAQTEVGRTVNTDSPFSSTTLASELHPRIAESSQRPPVNHVSHCKEPRRMTPHSEQRSVEIKREPSVEELPATRSQAPPSRPSSQMADMDDGRQKHLAISRRTPSQDRNGDQASSRPPSRANSLYVAQGEEDRRRSDPSAPVPPEQVILIRSRDSLHGRVQGTDVRGRVRQDSTSSDRSPPRWNDRDRRSRSPVPPRRPLSRSPSPYTRKRVRSGTPRYDSRQAPDYWQSQRSQWRQRPEWTHPVADSDRGRDRQYHDHDRERQGDSPRRYRPPPPRRTADTYRPSPSPAPPSPRQYRYERPSPRPGYRSPSPEYETQRFVGSDDLAHREPERTNTNTHEPTSEAEVRHTVEREEQQRWQRPTPSPSDRDRTPTPPPRLAEAEVGLLDRIDMMNEAGNRGRGRGRLAPGGATRGGPNPRRGLRGGVSGGRGRGVASGYPPALLTRMTGAPIRGIRPAHAPSLSDRMQQD